MTGFGPTTTALEVVARIDLTGRTALVTGAASGIETARPLAATGATVVLAVRDVAVGEAVAADIRRTTGNGAVAVEHLDLVDLDLVDLDTVDALVARWTGPLHVLVLNAGVVMTPKHHTADGWELQLATNHLGHVELMLGLHDALRAAGGAKVVSVSSSGHGGSPIVFDDLHFERRPDDPGSAYARPCPARGRGDPPLGRRGHHRRRRHARRRHEPPAAALGPRGAAASSRRPRSRAPPSPCWSRDPLRSPERAAATTTTVPKRRS